MTMPSLPALNSGSWYDWAQFVDGVARGVEGIKVHDGTTGGGTRPTGFARIRWIGGSTRPTNMVTGDIWEHDA